MRIYQTKKTIWVLDWPNHEKIFFCEEIWSRELHRWNSHWANIDQRCHFSDQKFHWHDEMHHEWIVDTTIVRIKEIPQDLRSYTIDVCNRQIKRCSKYWTAIECQPEELSLLNPLILLKENDCEIDSLNWLKEGREKNSIWFFLFYMNNGWSDVSHLH